jgi:integrase/recombinase XerC/integrase/recombinase XerD
LVGEVRALPFVVQDVRLADAAREFLGTIACPTPAAATRSRSTGCARTSARTAARPGWTRIASAAGSRSCGARRRCRRSNVRLAALRAAFDYWREQGWLAGDPLVRLVGRSVPRDDSRALTRAQVTTVLGLEVEYR